MTNGDKDQISILKRNAQAAMQAKSIVEARDLYAKLIAISPDDIDAWHALSTVNGKLGNFDEAESCSRQVLSLQPDHADAYINLGHVYTRREKYQEALGYYQKAVQLRSNSPVAYFNMGNISNSLGLQEEAIQQYQQAIRLLPAYANAHNNLGSLYLQRGDLTEAYSCYVKALEANPLFVIALNNLAKTCQSQDQIEKYFEFYRHAIAHLSDATEARSGFIGIAGRLRTAGYHPWLDDELRECLQLSDVEYGNPLALLTADILRAKYNVHDYENKEAEDIQAVIERIAADALFVLYIEKVMNVDPALEGLLTRVRRALLFKARQTTKLSIQELRVISALAFQCFYNEHVFALDEEEEVALADVKAAVEQYTSKIETPDEDLEDMLFIVGMYEDLWALPISRRLATYPRTAWSEQFRPFAILSLYNNFEEQEIKTKIESIGSIEDKTTQLVRTQYEENPYPRWLSVAKMQEKVSARQHLQSLFPHISFPEFLDGPIRILVAGCGTGKQPIQTALQYDNVEIVAVDISQNSLAYAIRQARQHGLKNIKFMQGDILGLAGLDMRFHIIECIGVLHHMEDPLAGWKVLAGLLTEGGLMRISLYSELARKAIVDAREIIKNEGIVPDKAAIRQFRTRVLRHELDPSIYAISRDSHDFFSTSECRDMFFHYQEHEYTLPRLYHELQELNLDFLGFIFADAKRADLYREQFPDDKEMRDLMSWDRFENLYPDTFINMYNFWCQLRT